MKNYLNILLLLQFARLVVMGVNSTDSVLVIDKNGPAETVSGRNLNWYKIKHNDLEGWVWNGLLKVRQ
ncbi:MAG TPA: hypothetical protein VKY45_10500 [Marinilabiliaceae bacterium]|nr:hypothetical protein [Marinilabiliaceae bacterium]